MKTAEELREEIATAEGCASWANLIATEDMSIGEKILEIDRCMKIYAKQVAEQALKDAAENATAFVYYHPEDHGYPDAEVDVDSILSTPIVTP